MEPGAYRPYCTKGCAGRPMFGLLNALAPRASSLGARAEKRTTLCKPQQGGPHRGEAQFDELVVRRAEVLKVRRV